METGGADDLVEVKAVPDCLGLWRCKGTPHKKVAKGYSLPQVWA